MRPEPARSNRSKEFYFKTSRQQLFFFKSQGGLKNWLYVLQALILLNPWCDRPVTIRPGDFCREFGKPWETGLMPDRSFRDSISVLLEHGLISIVEKRGGFMQIQVHSRALFFWSDAAESCQNAEDSGRSLPDRSAEALSDNGSSPLQTDPDLSDLDLDLDLLNKQESVSKIENSPNPKENLTRRSGKAENARISTPSRSPNEIQNSAPPVENVEMKIQQLGFEANLSQEPPSVLSTLAELLNSDRNIIKDALAAFWERRGDVRSPGRFLIKAIRGEWKPSRATSGPLTDRQFGDWFGLARSAGIAIASQRTDAGIVIHLANYRPPVLFSEMIQAIPQKWLDGLSVEDLAQIRWLIDRAIKGEDVEDDLARHGVRYVESTVLKIS